MILVNFYGTYENVGTFKFNGSLCAFPSLISGLQVLHFVVNDLNHVRNEWQHL